jgi:hypothetical protein
VLLVPGLADAQAADDTARATARRLGTAGVEAFQQQDYGTAVAKLEKAYEVLQAPSIGLWLARALAKQGKLVAANERYVEVGRLSVSQGDAQVQRQAQAEAAAELEALAPTIPLLTLMLEGATAAEVALSVDGVSRPSATFGEEQPIDPGQHRIEVKRGKQVVTEVVTLAPSEKKSVALRFGARPLAGDGVAPAADGARGGSLRRYAGWVAVGVGAVGLGLGGYFLLHASSKGDEAKKAKTRFDDLCEAADPLCFDVVYEQQTNAQLDQLASEQRSAQRTGAILAISGGVLAVGGAVLLLTARPAEDKPAIALTPVLGFGFGMATLQGTF